MPRVTLEYVAEKYRERDNLFMDLKWEEMLKKEEEFVALCKELASKKAMILSLPIFLNTKKEYLSDELLWDIGAYILLLSKDSNSIKKSTEWIGSHEVSFLNEKNQKEYINSKIEENDSLKMTSLITCNNYVEYIDEIIKNMNEEVDLRYRYIYFAILASFKQKKFYSMFLNAFEKEDKEFEKEILAYKLLTAPLPPIWKYYQNKISNKEEEKAHEFFYVVASYGSPDDWEYIKKLIENSMDNSDALIMIAYNLGDFGYVGGFKTYFKMLKHVDHDVRKTYHMLLLNFFYTDKDFLEEAEKIEDFESETLLTFWNNKKEYIAQKLDKDVHYWNGEPFDLLKVTEYKSSSSVIGELNHLVASLRIWTGENFAFDPHALFKRQFEQLEVIKQWLRDNKERFPAGRWYRWGVDVTEGYDEERFHRQKEKEKLIDVLENFTIKSNQTVPKTGRYQATLPKGHEQEEMLIYSGFDIKHLKEGERYNEK